MRPGSPEIALRPAQPYLGIRGTVADGGIRAFADQAFPELLGWLAQHGAPPAGPPFLRYYEVDHAGESLDVEAGVPVEGARTDGDGRVRADALPAGRYLTLLHI